MSYNPYLDNPHLTCVFYEVLPPTYAKQCDEYQFVRDFSCKLTKVGPGCNSPNESSSQASKAKARRQKQIAAQDRTNISGPGPGPGLGLGTRYLITM